MEGVKNYIECEMKYILDEGYEPSLAAEICARTDGRGPEKEPERSSEAETWDE